MENQVTDYVFTIIEDGQVPLAGNFDTFNYTPVIMAVIMGLALLAIFAYTVWFESHSMRLATLTGEDGSNIMKYYFHPIKLIRDVTDTEFVLLNSDNCVRE